MDERADVVAIFRACHLCYKEKLKRKDVAKRLKCSPARVTQLLAKAEEFGFVEIVVRPPVDDRVGAALREKIRQRLRIPLRAVYVALSRFSSVGEYAARFVEQTSEPGATLVLDGGRTVAEFVSLVEGGRLANLTVIPICADPPSYQSAANELATRLTIRCGASSHCLRPPTHHGPLLAGDLRAVRKAARSADYVVLGVGPWRPKFTALEFVRHLGVNPRTTMKQYPHVQCLSGYFAFDRDGRQIVIEEVEGRMPRALTLRDLKNLARSNRAWVVLTASSQEKVESVRTVLKSGICNTLLVDDLLARGLLSLL
jgi:DNA-binding transcriptional regulator LsrR (DeoR family)